ncbi:unnamed protein product, partial [Rotaria sp. Silwood2]
RNRLERLSICGYHSTKESDKYVGSSAATTVLRKTTNPKTEHRSSNSSDETLRRNSFEQNPSILKNQHFIEHYQPKISMRQTSIVNPFSFGRFNNNSNNNNNNNNNNSYNNYNGQQLLLTSGDIEAMTMRQFRMGSLGC